VAAETKEVMAYLEAKGTAQARKVYARHVGPVPMFGVSFAELNSLKRKIKTDQALADGLWASGIAEAKILAAMVGDPSTFTEAKVRRWVRETDSRGLRDYVGRLVARAPDGPAIAKEFLKSRDAEQFMMGLSMLSALAAEGTPLSTAAARGALKRIEREIHTAENWSRYTMMYHLIGIGTYNAELKGEAIAAAKRIGKVEFDPGETNCKVPDPVPYIQKAAAHHAAKGAKKAAKKAA
jgi:3-methyladenine DNA glycosylase AlkD